MNEHWWKNAVIYQVYPRSFQDSNGDGIGDIPGIISRLDYLSELGIDAIWLSPVYASPQADNGYDISDYEAIDPMFGTMADMDALIAQAKSRNIAIIMDLVLNHTSDEHFWFREACKSRDNPYHDYYVWQDSPPNDLRACFGGSAWTWVPSVEQYYFHQFAEKQPDLNWDNPTVREALYKMVRFWMDKGIAGFRLDVIDLIAKEPVPGITVNGPRLHDRLKELSRESFQRRPGTVTVGEAWSADVEGAKLYSAPDGSELSMVFQFQHLVLDQVMGAEKWDTAPLPFVQLKQTFAKWQTGLSGCGWNSLFWENHDLPRIISRWGDEGEYRVQSAKMYAIVLHGMQGTPYVYQGEELGMTNVYFEDIGQYRDLEILNMYQERLAKGYRKEDIMASIYARGRDNARTPMQWDASPNAGFSDATPWIACNPNYTSINAAQALADPDSVFHCYQTLIRLRKEMPIFAQGSFQLLLEQDSQIFAYVRKLGQEELLVLANFTGENAPCGLVKDWQNSQVLLHNYPDTPDGQLRPYEAMMLLRKN